MVSVDRAIKLHRYYGSGYLHFITTASPDDLIAVASSRDASGRYGFETSFSGGFGRHLAGGELSVDGNHNQLISVTNSGIKPAEARLTLHYDNGEKSYEMQQTIQPGDQMWVNVSELIHDRAPDRSGHTLPAVLALGSYDVRDLSAGQSSRGNLTESSLAVDQTLGASVVPSTVTKCSCALDGPVWSPDEFLFPTFDPDDDVVEAASIDATDECDDTLIYISDDFLSWASSDTAVATVATKKVTAVGAGTAVATADGSILESTGGGTCAFVPVHPSAQVTVKPTISSISPAQGLVGTAIGVTITGAGFASGATVGAGSNIKVSSVSVSSSTKITATFTPTNSSSAGGNQAVTVTVGGQKSNSQNFLDQVPTYFYATGMAAANNTCENPDPFAGVAGSVAYQVLDQSGNQIVAPGMIPQGQLTQNGEVVLTYNPFATPQTTAANGLFNDVPVGSCFPSIPPPGMEVCAVTVTQNFRVISSGATYPITTVATSMQCFDGVTVSGTGNPAGKNFTYTLGTP